MQLIQNGFFEAESQPKIFSIELRPCCPGHEGAAVGLRLNGVLDRVSPRRVLDGFVYGCSTRE